MSTNVVLTTDEVCEMLRISKQKLYEMVKKKLIRPMRFQNKPFLFTSEEVDRVIRDTMGTKYAIPKE